MQLFNSVRKCFVFSILFIFSSIHVQCSPSPEEDLLKATFDEMNRAYETLARSYHHEEPFVQKTKYFFNDVADVLVMYGKKHPDFVFQCYHFFCEIRSCAQNRAHEKEAIQSFFDLFRQSIIEYAAHAGWWRHGQCSLRSFSQCTENTRAEDAEDIETTTSEAQDTKPEEKSKIISWIKDHPLGTIVSLSGGCALCFVGGKMLLSSLSKDSKQDPSQKRLLEKSSQTSGLSSDEPAGGAHAHGDKVPGSSSPGRHVKVDSLKKKPNEQRENQDPQDQPQNNLSQIQDSSLVLEMSDVPRSNDLGREKEVTKVVPVEKAPTKESSPVSKTQDVRLSSDSRVADGGTEHVKKSLTSPEQSGVQNNKKPSTQTSSLPQDLSTSKIPGGDPKNNNTSSESVVKPVSDVACQPSQAVNPQSTRPSSMPSSATKSSTVPVKETSPTSSEKPAQESIPLADRRPSIKVDTSLGRIENPTVVLSPTQVQSPPAVQISKEIRSPSGALSPKLAPQEQCRVDVAQLQASFRAKGMPEEQLSQAIQIKEKLTTLGRNQPNDLTLLHFFSADETYNEARKNLLENLDLKVTYQNMKVKKKKVALLAVTENILTKLNLIRIQTTEFIIDFFGLADIDTAAVALGESERMVLRKLLYQGATTVYTAAGQIAEDLINQNKEKHQPRIETIFIPLIKMGVDNIEKLFERLPRVLGEQEAGGYNENDIINFCAQPLEARNAFLAKNPKKTQEELAAKRSSELHLTKENLKWLSRFEELGFAKKNAISLKEFWGKKLSKEEEESLDINLKLRWWAHKLELWPKLIQLFNANMLKIRDLGKSLDDQNVSLPNLIVEQFGVVISKDSNLFKQLYENKKLLELFSYSDFQASGITDKDYKDRMQDFLRMNERTVLIYCNKQPEERIKLLKLTSKRAIQDILESRTS